MEVHAPEHAIRSWRDFFVHMGTICLGLLIAIALEQGVEALNRARERADLRIALDADSREAIVDAKESEAMADSHIAWVNARLAQVRAAIATIAASPAAPLSTPLGAPQPERVPDFDVSDDKVFKAARTSGALSLLPQDDIVAYSEGDSCARFVETSFDDARTAHFAREEFENTFKTQSGTVDFSRATPDELKQYVALLTREAYVTDLFRFMNQQFRGVSMALLDGKRGIDALHAAERTVTSAP